jgi:SAM-dependent methyltransferase
VLFGDGRRWVCSRARGAVLELVVGTGRNLEHYPADVRVTGIELAPDMLDIARRRAAELDRDFDLRLGDAQALAFADDSFDTARARSRSARSPTTAALAQTDELCLCDLAWVSGGAESLRLPSSARAALGRRGEQPARRQDGDVLAHGRRPRPTRRRAGRRGGPRVSTSTAGRGLVVLPVSPAAPAPRVDEGTYRRLARRAKLLSWLILAWMAVEGAVAIGAGIVASSIALVGFGLDSAIEAFASVIIIWRFTGHRMFSAAAETRAQKLVAIARRDGRR